MKPHSVRSNRLMPALLDRLTDHAPQSSSEAPHERLISRSDFRESVLRDLSWLLNTVNAESTTDFEQAERARVSVVNFGIPALSGRQLAAADWKEVEATLRTAIATFEPRILPESLEIRVLPPVAGLASRNRLSLEIRGQLWSEPYPMELLLRSHVDLECGQVSLENVARS
ncbi:MULTISPECIES: type VI secretion system baseplate subunit TssE [Pseudomonas]|uniref:type VI secretion system baseplate subunit TssE n=1 Tax=Pseudomonas TaxID=286 RepID=UPI001C7F69C9|nr:MULTISPECIES: type VI secretion system baseplate subunit TssE [Pseudomonas]MDG9926947.1 type VI secretion system baseplate subunit TssE [Pseudomonas sp. GD04042]MDH0484590.1 type VI secretion system baseplate subunit TssE [Pseudomonas sp. GD04015]MDH0602362.1 type VI secretion system baseplate subunit TssE [Pseudomonas sp. GD03869]MDH0894063.1 type VI secretion system baseplate subunit TssE [Pseudomonas sp. GD03875]MDH1062818.1 type VI secretion system baseplate subunit TssE [Pseudomonas sp